MTYIVERFPFKSLHIFLEVPGVVSDVEKRPCFIHQFAIRVIIAITPSRILLYRQVILDYYRSDFVALFIS